MYLVRVTTLEKFRRWKDNVSDYDTEESFIESLTGVFTGNAYTTIGTAFHSIVENGLEVVTDVNGVKVVRTDNGPVYFNAEQVEVALKYKAETPQAIHELRLYKTYNSKYGKVTVTGCADQVDGYIIHDIKTKYRDAEQQEYMDSCQWRYYLELFGLDDFVFDLFQFVGYNTDMGTNVSGLQILRYEPIPCLRYATMEEDNANLLAGFLDYVFSKNLQQYIMEQPTATLPETINHGKLTIDATAMPELTINQQSIQQHIPAISNSTAVLKAITAITAQSLPAVSKSLNDCKKIGKEVDKEAEALCRPLKDAKKKIDEMQKEIKEFAVEVKSNLNIEVNRVENLILSFHQKEQERVNRERKIVEVFQKEGMAYDGVNIAGHGLSFPFADLLAKQPTELNAIILQIRMAKTQAMPFEAAPVVPQQTVAPATVMPPAVKGLTTIRKYEVVNPSIIPLEYYTLDTAKITAAVKAGVAEIPGVRIFEEKQIRTTK